MSRSRLTSSRSHLPIDEVLQAPWAVVDGEPLPLRIVGWRNSNACHLPGRWSRTRPCCWPTSRPVHSTLPRRANILRLLVQINEVYHTTIVLVTHNAAIAGMTDRVIRLRSGEIEDDRLVGRLVKAEDVTW